MTETTYKRKLIEVALPLEEINAACKADKERKTGTIRNLHKWFAPMPLPAWRALLFAALVDDPEDDNRRVYLLDLIKRLVANGADAPDEQTVEEAKSYLSRQYPDGTPAVFDPFCGGGSTLVEAQRLGLDAEGTDLNPVPTLITRVLTETLPRVWGRSPLHDEEASGPVGLFTSSQKSWSGYEGLAADVSYYSRLVLERAQARVAKYFPSTPGESVVAWIWARTAVCANPACGIRTTLSTTWWLSKKKGDLAWIEPKVHDGELDLIVQSGKRIGGPSPESPKVGRGGQFVCAACGALVTEQTLIEQGSRGLLGLRLVAVVYDSDGVRGYRSPTPAEEQAAFAVPDLDDFPDLALPDIPRWFSGPRFGLTKQADLYTKRQLQVLAAFADTVSEIHSDVLADGGSRDWASAIASVLGLSVGKLAQYNSAQGRWFLRPAAHAKAVSAFDRHDVPMMWDFPEVNVFYSAVGGWKAVVTTTMRALAMLPGGVTPATVSRADARAAKVTRNALVATDPPYFDAIGYADLSDFFYVWHRRALRATHPDLYATLAVPKSGELTAIPYHHENSADLAREYFIRGFTETFGNLKDVLAPGLPMLVVYASKEQKAGREEETRWASILTAMIQADLEITGAWPIYGTGTSRMVGIGTNAIATYIVMACRPRSLSASTCSLADFNRALRRELGSAVRDLQAASILAVDLPQAVLGPGMQIYSRYRAVLDQGGQRVAVDQALRLISAALAEVRDEQMGELDRESGFAVRWWETYGWTSAPFDEANKIARPLGITVDDVKRSQVARSEGNKVRLLGNGDLDPNWFPNTDQAPTAWEAVHHLAHRLIDRGGELEAARLMSTLGSLRDSARALTYGLAALAAEKGRASDQERYNDLINRWAELVKLSGGTEPESEERLF